MKRRDFLNLLMGTSPALFLCGCKLQHLPFVENLLSPRKTEDPTDTDLAEVQSSAPTTAEAPAGTSLIDKSRHHDLNFPDDLVLNPEQQVLLRGTVEKFRKVQNHVGFGHFNLVGMDEFFRVSALVAGGISTEEKSFLEEMFYRDATQLGFMGLKVTHDFTHSIDRTSVYKVPRSGHYLYRGRPLELFEKVQSDVGPTLVLTSGVRGVAKQFHLYMEKVIASEGNLSKASRSLAPPGYSFHGSGDFDVGRVNYGFKNFTEEFSKTDEYKRLIDLGYIDIRYQQDNVLGVRFEPWHIKVESGSAHSHGS